MINARRAVLGAIIALSGGDIAFLQVVEATASIGTSQLIYQWTILLGLGLLGTGLFAMIPWVWTRLRMTKRTLVLGYSLGLAGLIVIAIMAVILSGALVFEGTSASLYIASANVSQRP